jgi:Protein of unknown function (DUF2510)
MLFARETNSRMCDSGGNHVVTAAAGWYTDPEQQGQLRWWNGAAWTEHRSPALTPPQVAVVAAAPVAAPIVVQLAPPEFAQQQASTQSHPFAGAATAALATRATPATPARTSVERATKRGEARDWVLASVAVIVMVLLIGATTVGTDPTAVGSPASGTGQSGATPPATPPTMPNEAMPEMTGFGGVRTVSPGDATSTADDTWRLDFSHYSAEQMDSVCSPLAFGDPVNGSYRDSVDPMLTLPNLVSPSGQTSMSGGVQAFPSVADVDAYTSGVRALVTRCGGDGFTVGDGRDTVTPVTTPAGQNATLSWEQNVRTSTRTYSVVTTEWVHGTTVTRGWCYRVTESDDPAGICAQWIGDVGDAVSRSN